MKEDCREGVRHGEVLASLGVGSYRRGECCAETQKACLGAGFLGRKRSQGGGKEETGERGKGKRGLGGES